MQGLRADLGRNLCSSLLLPIQKECAPPPPPPPPPKGIESRETGGPDAKESYEESGVHLDGAKTVMWWRPLSEVWEGEVVEIQA